MEPNELGRIVLDDWHALPERLPHVRLDQVQLMPDHFHAIIAAFKSGTTIRMNRLRNTPGHRYWQKGYHDWRIRPTHAGEFERIARYIAENPANW